MFEEIYFTNAQLDKKERHHRANILIDRRKNRLIRDYTFSSKAEKNQYTANRDALPQRTYEIWDPKEEPPHLRRTVPTKRKRMDGDADGDDELEEEEEEEDEETSLSVDDSERNEDIENENGEYEERHTVSKDKFAKIKEELAVKGLEVGPMEMRWKNKREEKLVTFVDIITFERYNGIVLTELLHLSILRQQWSRAQNCFALLIRMQAVDLRAIWPLGLEILQKTEEERLSKAVQENGLGLDEKQIQILTNFNEYQQIPPFLAQMEESNRDKIQELIRDCNSRKVDRFLNWLRNYFGIHTKRISKMKASAWRSGSRQHSPMYVRTMVWSLLLKLDFKNCRDLLEELILQQPYINDGNFYYYLALCYQIEADYSYSFEILDQRETNDLLMKCLKNYLICYKDYKMEISYKIIKDLKKSFTMLGAMNVEDLFMGFTKRSEDEIEDEFIYGRAGHVPAAILGTPIKEKQKQDSDSTTSDNDSTSDSDNSDNEDDDTDGEDDNGKDQTEDNWESCLERIEEQIDTLDISPTKSEWQDHSSILLGNEETTSDGINALQMDLEFESDPSE